ncbi:hypothetical protein FS749_007006 [Ceratobasidium sp. UAMH 11750]|nr:hypothetical protein FS749_007006 [Ceratobasidium sp. UAMH 11750]
MVPGYSAVRPLIRIRRLSGYSNPKDDEVNEASGDRWHSANASFFTPSRPPPPLAMTVAYLLCLFPVLAAGLPAQVAFTAGSADPCIPSNNALTPGDTYCGDRKSCDDLPTKLRISNGGAGLSGLVGRLANEFIKYELKNTRGAKPFKIEWIKGDTTETLGYLGTGQADVGITYNKAAECQAVKDGVATRREYGFRDHFYLVGPKVGPKDVNPAGLSPVVKDQVTEDILQQFQKIVRTGNNPPLKGTPTRFLSRYDKSATNIKDSELFVRIGQVPWGLAYSKWYHQYTMYPIDALTAAALLNEYTITDRGTWLSTSKNITDRLTIYNQGADKNATDPLLNPAFFLASSCSKNTVMANKFLSWTISEAGQKLVENFRKEGSDAWLYTRAPVGPGQKIKDCEATDL